MDNLKLISFTGADNRTSVDELDALNQYMVSKSNIIPEWALLIYLEAEGLARNPDKTKRSQILELKYQTAAHLCGEKAFHLVLSRDTQFLDELKKYNRVQLNVNARKKDFSPAQIKNIYDILADENISTIFQFHQQSQDFILKYLQNSQENKKDPTNQTILFDTSKGRGISPVSWPSPIGKFCGYAGGLNPENIVDANDKIVGYFENTDNAYWLDMESGLRINNEFSLQKCKEVFDNITNSLERKLLNVLIP